MRERSHLRRAGLLSGCIECRRGGRANVVHHIGWADPTSARRQLELPQVARIIARRQLDLPSAKVVE